ncbi:hypothetical protein C0J52_01567 [Blattella germanica]|nr:hypothetical protein C0J52_01567 [Blattella germanica]
MQEWTKSNMVWYGMFTQFLFHCKHIYFRFTIKKIKVQLQVNVHSSHITICKGSNANHRKQTPIHRTK